LSVSPIKDEHGQLGGASKIARNITERRRAQEEIQFQSRLLDSVEQAVIATDLEGKVVFWNSFAESLYGWAASEAMGSSVIDLIPSAASKQQAEEIFSLLKEGQSWVGEMLVKKRD